MATGELRERVRERLVSAEHGARARAGGRAAGGRRGRAAARDAARRRRSRCAASGSPRALADFDAATIATTHGFCQEVLGGLGVAGDVEPDTTFVEDVSDLRRGGRRRPLRAPLRTAAARRSSPARRRWRSRARRSTTRPRRSSRPTRPTTDRRDARAAAPAPPASELEAAQAPRRRHDLRRPADAPADARSRARAARSPRRGCASATASCSSTSSRTPTRSSGRSCGRAFGDGDATLVLIGDPKQAIYAFRGADVYAYLEAAPDRRRAGHADVNWRSDQGLLDAYDALFGGAQLGHEGIVYRAGPRRATGRRACSARRTPAPLRVRVVHRDDAGVGSTAQGLRALEPARAARRLRRRRRHRLAAALGRDRSTARAAIRPGHIAVLVRTNRNAPRGPRRAGGRRRPRRHQRRGQRVRHRAGARVAARCSRRSSGPPSPPRARSAALTPFLGWTAEQVAAADDDAWEDVHRRLHHWARVLRDEGRRVADGDDHAERGPARRACWRWPTASGG